MTASTDFAPMPDTAGFFGPYGGQLVPPHLKQAMDDINAAYAEITQRQDFQDELAQLFADYVGRPSPIFHAKRLSAQLGGAQGDCRDGRGPARRGAGHGLRAGGYSVRDPHGPGGY